MSLGLDESKAESVASERAVDADYRVLRIIWLAILASLVAIFVVTRIVKPEPVIPKELFWVLFAMGLGDFGASFFLKHKLLRQAAEKRKPEMVKSAYIVGLALSESVGILGLVAHLLTGVEYYYFFFVLSGFGILLHKPQRDDILAAYQGGGIWEARRND